MPHVPLFVSDRFKGKTGGGVYGDVIAEIDWSVGQILEALKRTGLDEKTLVIFTSDNGPWLSYGNHAGSPGRFARARARRSRAACACRSSRAGRAGFPGARSRTLPAMTIDLLPTLASAGRRAAPTSAHRRPGHLAAAVAPARRAVAARRALLLLGRRAARRPQRQLEAALAAPLSVPRVGGRRRRAGQVRHEGTGAQPVRSRQGPGRVHQPRGQTPGRRARASGIRRARSRGSRRLADRAGRQEMFRPAGKL